MLGEQLHEIPVRRGREGGREGGRRTGISYTNPGDGLPYRAVCRYMTVFSPSYVFAGT